jgi:hypothetical protein
MQQLQQPKLYHSGQSLAQRVQGALADVPGYGKFGIDPKTGKLIQFPPVTESTTTQQLQNEVVKAIINPELKPAVEKALSFNIGGTDFVYDPFANKLIEPKDGDDVFGVDTKEAIELAKSYIPLDSDRQYPNEEELIRAATDIMKTHKSLYAISSRYKNVPQPPRQKPTTGREQQIASESGQSVEGLPPTSKPTFKNYNEYLSFGPSGVEIDTAVKGKPKVTPERLQKLYEVMQYGTPEQKEKAQRILASLKSRGGQ